MYIQFFILLFLFECFLYLFFIFNYLFFYSLFFYYIFFLVFFRGGGPFCSLWIQRYLTSPYVHSQTWRRAAIVWMQPDTQSRLAWCCWLPCLGQYYPRTPVKTTVLFITFHVQRKTIIHILLTQSISSLFKQRGPQPVLEFSIKHGCVQPKSLRSADLLPKLSFSY